MISIDLTIYLICNAILLYIILQLLATFYKGCEKNVKLLAIGGTLFYLLTYIVAHKFSEPILNFLVNIITIFVMTLAYKGRVLQKVLVALTITIINASSDILAYLIFTNSLKLPRVNLSFVGTVLIALICRQIVCVILGNREVRKSVGVKENILLLLIPLASLGILYSASSYIRKDEELITISLSVLLINISIFYLYTIMEEHLEWKIRNLELEKQISIYGNELQVLAKSQNRIRGIRHDMRHHIIELQSFLHKNELESLQLYLDKIYKEVAVQREYVRSENLQIDGLLNYLLEEANKRLENIETRISIPRDLPIHAYYLNAIIGNLIENAIEASEKTVDKKLLISIEESRGVLFIRIQNSHNIDIDANSEKLVSTKSNKLEHGIGLKNVKSLVKELLGEIQFKITEEIFEVEVVLYTNKI